MCDDEDLWVISYVLA